ncbi:hypothetical protein KBB08_04180 [Candidatus Gracilibacteria bacterium]|nr:hypothetical protein [Candidatus Gracilibacteria bacterium]
MSPEVKKAELDLALTPLTAFMPLQNIKEGNLSQVFGATSVDYLIAVGAQHFSLQVSSKTEGSLTSCTFTISTENKKEILFSADISLHRLYGHVFAYTRLHRTDLQKKLPQGFGMSFYRKILEFIPAIVTACRTTITHIESFEPEVSDREQKLSTSRWLEMCLPVFLTHGYQPGGHNFERQPVWQKIYRFLPDNE